MHFADSDIIKNVFLFESTSIEEALEYYKKIPYYSLPVVDQNNLFVGVLLLKDILFNQPHAGTVAVVDYVTRFPAATLDDDPIEINWPGNVDILPLTDADNKYIGFVPGKHLCAAWRKEYKTMSAEYDQVINSTYNGIVVIDVKEKVIVYNPAAERILGKKRGDVLGKHISCLDSRMGLSETLEAGKPNIAMKVDLGEYIILTNRTPLLDSGGKITGAMGVFIDISDIEHTISELEANKAITAELNAIIESSYDGLYVADKNGKVVRVNASWEKICGFTREEILGKTAAELVSTGMYDNSAALLALQNKETSTVMLEITSGPKKGQKIIATGTPFFGDDGELNMVVVNVRDFTALEILKHKLEETKALTVRYATELSEIRLQQIKMDDIVCKSSAMQRIIDLAVRVSQVDSTVMLTGESGVGKEVVVRKIHQWGKRKEGSFIKINCGAIPENLLESELFGYEGGAFTGARREGKPGLFEIASGGTLFLDEIGDLPLNLQVKLLRALQEREITRVGGSRPIKIDTRIISATNKDIARMVSEGSFRQDLFYRLNVIHIFIPPLRDRKEDLPALINLGLQRLNSKYELNKSLSPAVVDRFYNYNWPGNIRELENVLERIIVLTNDDLIQTNHLPEFLQTDGILSKSITLNRLVPLKNAVEETEFQLIKRALKEHGTTRKAAKILEVNQSTIVRKMQQYRLDKDDAEEHRGDALSHQREKVEVKSL